MTMFFVFSRPTKNNGLRVPFTFRIDVIIALDETIMATELLKRDVETLTISIIAARTVSC